MPEKLSYQFVRSVKPGAKDIVIRDTEVKGFMLRVRPHGKKTYAVEYERNRRVTIGDAAILTPQQARDRAIAILAKSKYGIEPDKKSQVPTLERFLDDRYAPSALADQKSGAANLARLRKCFQLFLNRRLDRITAEDVERWRSERLAMGRAKSTINRDVTALKAALNKAVLWKVIPENPIAAVKPKRVDRRGIVRYLSKDENKRLRAALDQPNPRAPYIKPMVLLALNTGLRRGELLSLQWQDVDFESANLTVAGTYAKNAQTRHVGLNSEAMAVLREWQGNGSDYVFGNAKGGRLGHFKRSWARIKEMAEIENFRFHDLRHDFCSKLAMAGVDLNTVRELAGHMNFEMTLRYAHLSPDHKKAAVERLVTKRANP